MKKLTFFNLSLSLLLAVVLIACNNHDGFVKKFDELTQNLQAGSSNGAARRYALVSNTHSDTKNISVLSFRLLNLTGTQSVLATDNVNGMLNFQDLKRELNLDITAGNRPIDMDVSRNGQKLAVANYGDGTISIKDISYLKSSVPVGTQKIKDETATIPVGNAPIKVRFGLDNQTLWVLDAYGYSVHALDAADVASAKVKKVIELKLADGRTLRPTNIAFSLDGKSVLVTCTGEKVIALIDTKTFKVKYKELPFEPVAATYVGYKDSLIVATPNHVIMLNGRFMEQEETSVNKMYKDALPKDKDDGEYKIFRSDEDTTGEEFLPKFAKTNIAFMAAQSVMIDNNVEEIAPSFDSQYVCAIDSLANKLYVFQNTDNKRDEIDPLEGLQLPLASAWAKDIYDVVAEITLPGVPKGVAIDPISNKFALVTISGMNEAVAVYLNGTESKILRTVRMGNEPKSVRFLP